MDKLIQMIEGIPMIESVMGLMGKVSTAALGILIGFICINVVKRLITRTVAKSNRISERKMNTVRTICNSVARYVFYFVILCNVMSVLGINTTSILALGGAVSVAIGLGAQSLIQDVVTGVFILIEDQFGVGDMVCLEGYSGKVESIGLRTTSIRSADGDLFIVPNGQIKIVTNMSKGFNRAMVDVGVAYEENLEDVIKVLENEMQSIYDNEHIQGLINKPEVLGVVELGDSAVVIKIKADCEVGENWAIERELRRLVKNRFDKEGIQIPYPQRVVYIKEDN